jgi:hypothetical protein
MYIWVGWDGDIEKYFLNREKNFKNFFVVEKKFLKTATQPSQKNIKK